MTHQFKIEVAEKYGILEAILLDHIVFWIAKNEANETNQYNGNTWTYNSIKAFCELFPYASEKKLRNALKHIEDEGLIETGNFNKSTYDRTKWYALTPKGQMQLAKMGYSILPKGQMEVSERANGITQKGEPIPSTTTSTYPSTTNNIISDAKPKKPKKANGQFRKPSVDDIQNYIFEKGLSVDAEHFYDYYESNGWKVGKSSMKDWKATLRNWERNKDKYDVAKPKEESRQELFARLYREHQYDI